MNLLRNKRKVFSDNRYMMVVINFGENNELCRIIETKPGFDLQAPFNVDKNEIPFFRTIEQEELTVFSEINESIINKMHCKFNKLI